MKAATALLIAYALQLRTVFTLLARTAFIFSLNSGGWGVEPRAIDSEALLMCEAFYHFHQ